MPVLYKPDENNFNHNGLGGLHGLLAYEVTEVLNGELELYMEYPVNGNLYEYIQDGVLIKAKPNRYDDPHVFRVYESELDITTQVIQIYAHSNTYDLQGNFVKDLAIRDMTPQQAMNMLKTNAVEPVDFTFSSDIATQSSAYWENRSVLSCINGEEGSLLQIWGGEIKRGNKQLWLYARRGRDNVTTVRHSKNLSGLKATYSTKGLVTAILPYFNHRDEESDRETVIHGNIVYSDLVNKYPLTYYNAVEFNEEDGVTDLASLNAVASRYFENNEQDKPKVNIEIQLEELSQTKEYDKFKDFEQINIGDTFTTYSEKHKVEITAKAFKVVYDGLRDKTKEIEAGTTRATAYDAYRELFGRITDRSLRPIAEQLHIIQRTADGKNNIFRGVAEPPNEQSQEGDLWFKPVGEGMGEIYQFNGANWEIIIGQEVFDQIDMAIEDAKGQADQAVIDAEEAGQRASDALIKAGESDDIAKAAKDAADRAETNATAAGNKAADALAQSSSAVTAAEEAIQSIATFEPLVAGAVTKADDAIAKANNIPITIDNTITAKGLVSGDWVNTRIDDATGEINYAITSVKGEVPNVVMGVEWSKISSPELSRTDYVEEFTSLADYQLKTAEYDLSIDGLTSNLQAIEVNKLDSSEFTSFKSNEYSQTVNGITNRLSSVESNKLEDSVFTSFKENDYQVTVDGLAGRLTTVETDKLEHADFTIFKENDYQLTVDGLKMGLTSVEGAIPTLVLGVSWSRSEDPAMTRTDYAEDIDLTDYYNPDYIMGAIWDKSSDPTLERSDGVQELVGLQEYKTQTADFEFTLNGFGQTLASIETKKLDSSSFESFKTGDYENTIDGITGRLTSVETDKLTKSEFQSFKTNDYSVTVDGLAGRLTSVESNKLDSSTFQTFKTSDYSVTVDGLNGKIQSLETEKLDSADFSSFKTNDYQLTVNGFDMALTSVSGAIPTIVLGVSWSRASNPEMERTDDAAAIDLSNYDNPDYIMGVEWQRNSEPEMDRIRDTQEFTSTKDFEIFLGDYNFKAEGWNATNAYINDNKTSINSLISNAQGWSNTISYVDENKTAINETISQVTHYKQTIIGENGEKIAQLVMTDDAFVTRVSDLENMTADIVLGVEWERVSSPKMVRTGFMEDWASSQISQLSDNINLKVSKGDLLSEINTQADGVLIRSGDNKLNITPETTYIQSATIQSAQISSVHGNKITANTLHGNRIIANTLDVGAITGNISDFVASYWNDAAGGGVSIDGNGILSIAANKSQTYIQNGIVGTRNPNGATIGQIGYINTGTIATYSLRTSWGSHFELRQRSNETTEYTMLRAENGATNFFINARNGIYLRADNTYDAWGNLTSIGRVNVNAQLRITSSDDFRMAGGNIIGLYGVYLTNGGEFYTLSGGSATRIGFGSELQFRQGATSSSTGTQKMMIDSTRNYMYQTLNMQGNSITESPSVSDGRLKDISGDRVDNDLQKLLSVKYVNFMWKEDGKPDFGFIAQQIQGFAPEIVRDVNGGWLGYDQASYTHLIGHALQQHAGITANQLTQLRQENEALHDRITGLEVRITELERAM